jgi:hypothetical protein
MPEMSSESLGRREGVSISDLDVCTIRGKVA